MQAAIMVFHKLWLEREQNTEELVLLVNLVVSSNSSKVLFVEVKSGLSQINIRIFHTFLFQNLS